MTMSRGVLLMLLLNVLIVAAGVAASYFILKPSLDGTEPAAEQTEEGAAVVAAADYEFFSIEKVIVSLQDGNRERYFVLDLSLMAEAKPTTEAEDEPESGNKLQQIEPIVRNSVVAYLSSLEFKELRALAIPELQARLEEALRETFIARRMAVPFEQVLVSKLLVQ